MWRASWLIYSTQFHLPGHTEYIPKRMRPVKFCRRFTFQMYLVYISQFFSLIPWIVKHPLAGLMEIIVEEHKLLQLFFFSINCYFVVKCELLQSSPCTRAIMMWGWSNQRYFCIHYNCWTMCTCSCEPILCEKTYLVLWNCRYEFAIT